MTSIILATNNFHKVKEFQKLFKNENISSLADVNYEKDIIENGKTFAENALIKAKQVAHDLNCIAISDDSGLEVEALNNAPGIYSARYAITNSDEDNNKLLIKNLNGIENRTARYVCAICVFHPNGDYRIVEGVTWGEIIDEARGKNGFGYDPHFYVKEIGKTFAEISLEEKNKMSHRARAMTKLMEVCDENFNFK